MKAVFFPKNNLTVNVCRCFNGHLAPITFNTDRLKDGKYALAEVEAFRNDVQLTSFLNPRYDFAQENVDYGNTLKSLDGTGRWSWGLYYNTNSWLNPFTNVVENIPGYGATVWTQVVADFYNSHGATITVGSAKTANYPNHGGNLYTLTNGHMGWDRDAQSWGSETQGRESTEWMAYQINVFVELFGMRASTISYMNGIVGFLPYMLIPQIIAGRNSNQSYSGNSNILYQEFNRISNNNRASNTRAWDLSQAGTFPSQQAAIDYTLTQIQYAIDNAGFFTDFAHIHSFYEYPDLAFVPLFYYNVRQQIGSQDVWNAGYGEAMEYAYMRDSIKKFGSFQHEGNSYFFYQIKDNYKGTLSVNISNDLDYSTLKTPLSFKIDTTGTDLQGKNIKCDEAVLIRNLGNNKWIISVPYRLDEEGYARFKVYEGITEYYSATRPTITRSINTISTDIPSKVVVWRKPIAAGLADIVEVGRYNNLGTIHTHTIESGYTYYVGAISKYKHSSLIEVTV